MVALPLHKPAPPARGPSQPPSPPPAARHVAKTFAVSPWSGHGEGEKVVSYGPSGSGKTTLFAQFPGAIFIGLDDGGRKIRNPITGEPVRHVDGVETFDDVRDAVHQTSLFKAGEMCVIDTLTVLETVAEPYMFATIPYEKGGKVQNLAGYGYGKGFEHLCDTMRVILQDLDALIRRGVHVGLICQNATVKKANSGGLDFLEDGPKLSHPASEKYSVRLMVTEWADHVVRIAYQGASVQAAGPVREAAQAKVGKASGTLTRAIFTMPEPHFVAKTRSLTEAVISFETPQDTSFWEFLLPGTADAQG